MFMAYSILQLKNTIIADMHGTTLNQITDFNGKIFLVASRFILAHDWMGTKRTSQVCKYIYKDVFDYVAPIDLKGNRIIDIYPQINRGYDSFNAHPTRSFDMYKSLKNKQRMSVDQTDGLKTIKIQYLDSANPIVISALNGLSNYMTTIGTGENLVLDQHTVSPNSGSLNLDILTGTGGIEINLPQSQQITLTPDFRRGAFFVYVYVDNPTTITNFILKVGKDKFNYLTMSSNKTVSDTSLIQGINLIKFEINSAIETGSVLSNTIDDEAGETILDENGFPLFEESILNPSDPNYNLQYNFNISFAQVQATVTSKSNINFSSLSFSLGEILMVKYYSNYLFRDSITGAWQETITNDSNLINLEPQELGVFVHLCKEYIARQQAGADSGFDYQFEDKEFMNSIDEYKRKYPSEIMTIYDNYYDTTLNWNAWNY